MAAERAGLLVAVVLLTACGEAVAPPPAPPSRPSLPAGPELRVDADGFFEERGAWRGLEFHPGRGVRCLVPGARIAVGRIDDGATEVTLYRRMPGGNLVEHACRLVDSPVPMEPTLRSEIASAVDRREPRLGLLVAALGRVVQGGNATLMAPDPPATEQVEEGIEPPDAGADLAEWVPDDLVFVRLRSVTAAYRFAGEMDALCAHFLDGRSFGTLRLTLHDLLLPSIWYTNPDVQTGVGDMALVVAPPLERGRLRVALLLRIADQVLHHQQTEAGISLESSPAHLWRPQDDPFPEERDRRNHRRIVGDVEIVSTDGSLLERLAAGVSRPVARSEEYAAARREAGDAARDEALFAVLTRAARERIAAQSRASGGLRAAARADRGVGWLVERWTGLPEPAVSGGVVVCSVAPPAGLRWVRVTTDRRGANVRMGFDTAQDASTAAAGLVPDPDRADVTCRSHLRDLAGIALVERGTSDLGERCFVVLGFTPACPAGGTYTAHPVTREVRCSEHGTGKEFTSRPAPDPRIRDLAADDREVSFRLEIDWARRQ